jgi:hypothetical protein
MINCQGEVFLDYKNYLIDAKYFEHFSFSKISPHAFSRMVKSWALSSFGNGNRLKEYFMSNKIEILRYLIKFPEDIISNIDRLNGLNRFFLKPVESLNEVFLKQNEVFNLILGKFSNLATEDIIDKEDMFEAFLSRDTEFFCRYLNIETIFFDEFREFLHNKFRPPFA